MRCAVLSLLAGAVVGGAVEFGVRASAQPDAVAVAAGVAVALLVGLGVRGWVLQPFRNEQAAMQEGLRAAEEAGVRLAALEASTSSLRHDLRGILSPALLTADRLLGSEDRVVKRAGEAMVRAVERAEARLGQTRDDARDDAPPG